MKIRDTQIDQLIVPPNAWEWLDTTGARTLGELIDQHPDLNNAPSQTPFQDEDDDVMTIGDNIYHAVGSLICAKLAAGELEPK